MAVVEVDRQTAKFNSPPSFRAVYGISKRTFLKIPAA